MNILRKLLGHLARPRTIGVVIAGIAVAAAAMVLVTVLRSSPTRSRYGDPALDALVAVPEQLYSPPNPRETFSEAAKRIEPLITHDLFTRMSAAPLRQTNYKMGPVADQYGTVKAQAYIDDHGVKNGDDTKTSVSRTVIVIQQITFPDGRRVEDKFGLLVDAVLDSGKWKVKQLVPEPSLDGGNPTGTPPKAPPQSSTAPASTSTVAPSRVAVGSAIPPSNAPPPSSTGSLSTVAITSTTPPPTEPVNSTTPPPASSATTTEPTTPVVISCPDGSIVASGQSCPTQQAISTTRPPTQPDVPYTSEAPPPTALPSAVLSSPAAPPEVQPPPATPAPQAPPPDPCLDPCACDVCVR